MSATVRSLARRDAQPTSAPHPAVRIADVSKSFRLPHQRYHTLKERALHPFRSRTYDVLRAVDEVSVDVQPGEFFGIVGRNGSGKSTLLKCIAGIYDIDRGELTVRGRLSPFIELGVGFNMDLTARDNVMINAIMLGLTRKEARARFDEIIAFAELEEFLDLKLKNYSSGMSVRLAFAVAIQVDADVLLIDEVLAVGDAAFQQKCFEEFHRLKAAGRTILFVTHDMGAVERFCDRAMVIERGRIAALGEPSSMVRLYNELNFGRLVHEPTALAGHADRAAEVVMAWFESLDGRRIVAQPHGEPCRICIEARFHADVEDPVFAFTLRNEGGSTVFAATSERSLGPTGKFRAGERALIRIRFENWLAESRYRLTPSVARSGPGAAVIDLREDVASLTVHGGPVTGGVAHLPHGFEVERA
jgi:ABC-type polysaccharide/polyol phosphate transport system ATPase subunit